MGLLHSFVKIKAIEQLRREGRVPISNWGEPENAVSSMLPFFGDGKTYYVVDTSGTYRYLHATTGEVVGDRRAHLYEVVFNDDHKPVAVKYVDVLSDCLWLASELETVPNLAWHATYATGDQIYVNAAGLVASCGYETMSFYGKPCEVLDVTIDGADGLRYYLRSPEGNTAWCYETDILGRVSDMPDATFDSDVEVRRCRKCGAYYITQASADPAEELCPSCSLRLFITPYHRYSPPLHFWHVDDNTDARNKLYYGFELEIDEGGEKHSIAAEIVKRMNPDPETPSHPWFMYCSHDGSLNNGMELISMPATLAYHHSQREVYAELFKWLKSNSYLSHNTSTCGLHFHFSRAFFDDAPNPDECVSKLLYLVERFWDELTVFSRRDYKSLSHYAKKIDMDPDDFFDQWNKNHDHDGHYYSVNITNDDTIEFRMFRGTLNVDTFFATLDLVDAFVHLAKEKDLVTLQSMAFEDVLPNSAKAYYLTRAAMAKFED